MTGGEQEHGSLPPLQVQGIKQPCLAEGDL